MHSSLRLPLLAAGLALLASPAVAISARTSVDASLLIGPAKTYASVGVVPANTRLTVLWCGTTADWCLVDLKHRLGWLPLAVLRFSKQQDVTAVVEQGDGHGPSGPIPADPAKPVIVANSGPPKVEPEPPANPIFQQINKDAPIQSPPPYIDEKLFKDH